MMKTLIILFAADNGSYGFKNAFEGKSAFFKTLEWAHKLNLDSDINVFCLDGNKDSVASGISDFKAEFDSKNDICFTSKSSWNAETLFASMADAVSKSGAEYVLYNFAYCPFLNIELAQKLIKTHEEYKSEYSFADGYPYGVCPEILDKGLVNILKELIKTKEDLKDKNVEKTTVFDLLNTDINSFEIETEISNIDWRLYRFDFTCDKKENFIACKNLYEALSTMSEDDKKDIQKVITKAKENTKVLKTIPAYFNIQIETDCPSKCTYCAYSVCKKSGMQKMDLEKFRGLVKSIDALNPDGVVSLSLWGEPLLHPDFFDFAKEVLKYEGLSLLVETTGINYKDENVKKNISALKEACGKLKQKKNGYSPLMWIVSVDAMSQKVYEDIHPGMKLDDALESVKFLNSVFSGDVYAQFLRLKQNEDELENFYRTFKEKTSLSDGNFIIQKYDDFCKKLGDFKSADLSPVDRLPCWHLRRDMNILSNGDVCVCKNKSFEAPLGNAFTEDLETIWNKIDLYLEKHIAKNYCDGCEACDEFYTFNF